MPVFMSPFSFLTLLIWIFSLYFFIMWIMVCLSSSFSQRTSSLFNWLFVWFTLSWSYLFLGWMLLIVLECSGVNLQVWDFFTFLMLALSALKFPLSTAFVVSHSFGYVGLHFRWIRKYLMSFLFLPWPRICSTEHCQFPWPCMLCI